MKSYTESTKQSEIQREWHIIDMSQKILGRVSTDIAKLLMGKSKPYFVRNLDCGDYVVIVNAKSVSVTGKKKDQKVYYRYTGYPGGLTKEVFKDLQNRKPDAVIIHAVKGMLPQNRLRDHMLKRLFIFEGDTHPYQDKFKSKKSNSKANQAADKAKN